MGERRRWCYESGDWNWAENGDAECIRKYYLYSHLRPPTAAYARPPAGGSLRSPTPPRRSLRSPPPPLHATSLVATKLLSYDPKELQENPENLGNRKMRETEKSVKSKSQKYAKSKNPRN